MRWYERIIQAHTSVEGAKVSHYRRLDNTRYFVWQEEGAGDFEAGNRHAEKVMTGVTEFFTLKEFDPLIDAIEEAYDAAGIAWALDDVTFEDETGLIHYTWRWSVHDGPEENNG